MSERLDILLGNVRAFYRLLGPGPEKRGGIVLREPEVEELANRVLAELLPINECISDFKPNGEIMKNRWVVKQMEPWKMASSEELGDRLWGRIKIDEAQILAGLKKKQQTI